MRIFHRFETLVSYLREIGIMQFDVDATAYDPSAPLSDKTQSQAERARAQMQAAHAAAAYDKWFAAKIDAALAEAEDPAVRHVLHADAMVQLDAALTRPPPPDPRARAAHDRPVVASRRRSQWRICVPPRRIHDIVKGERAITADTAVRLAAYFHTDPQSWMNLQSHYDTELAREKIGEASLSKITKHEDA